jgi:NAD(P)-dependent dehydrogenase (short-subunit alcohol dehydrogenase family)
MKLKNQAAIITGSGSGIGRAIAIAFAREGADVVVADIHEENCFKVLAEVKKYSPNSLALKVDVSKGNEVEGLVRTTWEKYRKIDILVNNAGTGAPYNLEDTPEEDWDRIMGINLKGVFLSSQRAGKIMIQQKKGNIINIASISAHTPIPQGNAYSMAKAGVTMLTRLAALEWGKYNIRVNSISPGLIRTPLTENVYADPEQYKQRSELVPLKRIGTSEDVAKLALFLASEDSSYIHGEDIVIDGGLLTTVYQQVPGRASIQKK